MRISIAFIPAAAVGVVVNLVLLVPLFVWCFCCSDVFVAAITRSCRCIAVQDEPARRINRQQPQQHARPQFCAFWL